jgi:hypothetical protein
VWLCAPQYKELEAELKSLKESRDTAQNEADQESQRIIKLEANVSAADEKRRSCRKQLAEVRGSAGRRWPGCCLGSCWSAGREHQHGSKCIRKLHPCQVPCTMSYNFLLAWRMDARI